MYDWRRRMALGWYLSDLAMAAWCQGRQQDGFTLMSWANRIRGDAMERKWRHDS